MTDKSHLMRADRLLAAQELQEKYTTDDGGGEHPQHLRRHWKDAVNRNDTQRGYWGWVEAQIEQEAGGST